MQGFDCSLCGGSLKAAAEFGASRPDVKSADVLKIADGWLGWAEQPA